MNELSLFTGSGGGLLASRLLGWRTVCAVELAPYCRSVLTARQDDGTLGPFPIWDDVRTFDGKPWRGAVDIVTGGFPCQDISSAGTGKGLAGDRSGLWFEMLRIIGEVRPAFVLAENSPRLRTRGLGTIIKGLVSLGYDCRWGVLGARHVGAPHRRDRMWILAHVDHAGVRDLSQRAGGGGASPLSGVANEIRLCPSTNHLDLRQQQGRCKGAKGQEEAKPRADSQRNPNSFGLERAARQGLPLPWWGPKSLADFANSRMADGVAHRMDRIRATGNGQVPAVVALAWETLSQGLV